MRRNGLRLGEDDRRAMAGGAAAGFGLMAALALRADWLIVSGMVALRQADRSGAAVAVGTELLPWMLLLTGLSLIGTIAALSLGLQMGRASGAKPVAGSPRRGRVLPCRPHFAGR